MTLTRRSFLAAALAAPAVVRSGILMPVREIILPPRLSGTEESRTNYWRNSSVVVGFTKPEQASGSEGIVCGGIGLTPEPPPTDYIATSGDSRIVIRTKPPIWTASMWVKRNGRGWEHISRTMTDAEAKRVMATGTISGVMRKLLGDSFSARIAGPGELWGASVEYAASGPR